MLSVYGQGITALQVKEGIKYFEENKDTLIPGISSNSVTRVYGDGGGMEHSQERHAGAKTLSIICRF